MTWFSVKEYLPDHTSGNQDTSIWCIVLDNAKGTIARAYYKYDTETWHTSTGTMQVTH